LLQRNWEENRYVCINYVHNDRFLIIWKTFFVQCSYAKLLLLQSGSPHNQTAADCFIDNVGAAVRASNCSRRASFTMIARGEGRPRFLLLSVEVRT